MDKFAAWLRFVNLSLWLNAARKRFIESRVQSLDPQAIIDSYLQVLDLAKEKRDMQKRYLDLKTFRGQCKWSRIHFGSVLVTKASVCLIFSPIFWFVTCSKYNIADGMRQMFDPFERVARAHHICPCCERPFSAEEEDDFVKKVDLLHPFYLWVDLVLGL